MLTLPTIAQAALDVRPIDWCGLPRRFLNPGEAEVLVALMRSVSPKRVVEIGVNEGRTAKLMLTNVPGIESYIGIDVPPGYVTAKTVQRREVPQNPGHHVANDPRFKLIVRPRGSFDVTPDDLGSADVVFIDGDHGDVAVGHDTVLAERIVREGGMIIWHDYHDLGTVDVRDVLHRFAEIAPRPILHVEGTWIAYQIR